MFLKNVKIFTPEHWSNLAQRFVYHTENIVLKVLGGFFSDSLFSYTYSLINEKSSNLSALYLLAERFL